MLPCQAQTDTTPLRASLWSFTDDAWFRILDRDAARGGRLSDRGILQRFWPNIDPDYQINLLRMRFDLADDWEWYHRARGARYWGGSINTRDQVIEAEFKEAVPLGRSWSAGVHFNKQDLEELRRNLVRLELRRTAASGAYGFVEGTFLFIKPSSDIGAGAGWRRGETAVELALTVLDAFNDLIYGDLKVQNTPADTALDYERQPVFLRTNLDLPLAPGLRLEGHAGVLAPSTVRAFVQAAPDSGFRQAERYGYGGALVEWQATRAVTAGVFAAAVRAVTDRTPLPSGRPLDDFRLTERTIRSGGVLLARLPAPWVFQGWVARMWRPERRIYRSGAAPDVDYEDRSWSGQAVLAYRPTAGFTGSLALDADLRDVVRGAGEVPSQEGSQARHNNEIRLDFGWRARSRSAFLLGLAFDLDPGIWPRGWFGGAHARWVLYW